MGTLLGLGVPSGDKSEEVVMSLCSPTNQTSGGNNKWSISHTCFAATENHLGESGVSSYKATQTLQERSTKSQIVLTYQTTENELKFTDSSSPG